MNNYNNRWKSGGNNNFHTKKQSAKNFFVVVLTYIFSFIQAVIVGIFRLIRWFVRLVMKQKGLPKKILTLAIGIGLVGFIVFALLFTYYSFTLPNPNELGDRKLPESTKILDRNGEVLFEVFGEAKRELVPIEEIPEYVKQAAISIEDQDFYKHRGVDFSGILRAVFVNIASGDPTKQGGSTITQQFVRNAVLTLDKTYTRKLKEAILAIQLEQRYSKDEILQLYFNEIPYGSNAYGVQAASQTFFDKDVHDLTLKEAAYLASLPKAPTYFSPYGPNREDLDQRANTVLALMEDEGYISEEQKTAAQNQEVDFRQIGVGIKAPHFSLYVQNLLAQEYGEVGLREGGFRVTTSLDLELQEKAEEAIANHAERNEQNYNATNASLVAIDPRSGQILAMVGSRDFFNEEIDGAVNVALRNRQPGSSFKPYVYATAFKEGMNPATMLMDVVTNFGSFGGADYTPQNFNFQEYGPVSIRKALQGSLNIPAVKTIILVGVNDAINTAESMGISTLTDRSRLGPSLVLGGAEVKLLDHTSAFGVFANGGIRHEPVAILKIEDKDGEVLFEYEESRGREVLDPQVAYQINNVLSDNSARAYVFGTNSVLSLGGRPVAAKTGTTQESKDAWTIGYTPSLVAGVWAGNNKPSPMRGGGSTVAGPIWNEFMRKALEGTPVENFSRPEGIIDLPVDTISGLLPTPYTPETKTEVFASFNVPEEEDDVHIPVVVGDNTEIYTVLRSQMPENSAWEDPVRRWALENGYRYPPEDAEIGELDKSIEISLDAPKKVTSLPWSVEVQAKSDDEITSIEVFLDNRLLASSNNASLNLSSNQKHVNGDHRLSVQIKTASGGLNTKLQSVEFDLGELVIISSPEDNQTVSLPTNIVLESQKNIAPENVKYIARDQSGNQIELNGRKTKQQSGNIFIYTLGLDRGQISNGSYALQGQVGGETSPSVTVKILN